MSREGFVAVDWGTSSLRGARVDATGQVLEERAFPGGILGVAAGGFDDAFHAAFGDWLAPDRVVLISGMAGSRQGWVEAAYCACPAGFSEVASRLTWLDARATRAAHVAIVPGLSCLHPSNAAHGGVPDVMRGEEVQIFGAMQALDLTQGRFVLPGTHNKWAEVAAGRIVSFSTAMTGEFFALLSQHSILARTLDTKAPHDTRVFAQGVRQSLEGGGLLHNAFSARSFALFSRLPEAALASYLSGLLIGEELVHARVVRGDSVVLIGAAALCERYAEALEIVGAGARTPEANATWLGLHAIWRTLG